MREMGSPFPVGSRTSREKDPRRTPVLQARGPVLTDGLATPHSGLQSPSGGDNTRPMPYHPVQCVYLFHSFFFPLFCRGGGTERSVKRATKRDDRLYSGYLCYRQLLRLMNHLFVAHVAEKYRRLTFPGLPKEIDTLHITVLPVLTSTSLRVLYFLHQRELPELLRIYRLSYKHDVTLT